jgi:hypothetical protein
MTLPEPEEGQVLEPAPGWFHLRGIGQVLRSRDEKHVWLAKAAAKQSKKLKGLLDYLQIHGAKVLDEAVVRVDGAAFVVCQFEGATHCLTVRGNLPKKPLNEFDQVNGFSGRCLWSSPTVEVTTSSLFGLRRRPFDLVGQASSADLKKRVTKIQCADEITGCEEEASARINHGLAGLMRGVRVPKRTVTQDIPRGHYYLYVLDGSRQKRIPIPLREYWCKSVDDHSEKFVDHDQKQLKKFLSHQKGLTTISRSTEMDRVAPWIKEQMLTNRVPSLLEIVGRLAKDPIWEKALQALGIPKTVNALNGYAFSIAYIKLALSGQLAVGLDNGSEGKIYENVAKVAKKHPSLSITGLAVLSLESFFAFSIGREHERPGMYHNDPGHHLVTPAGWTIGMSQLLRQLYPSPGSGVVTVTS